MGKICDAIGEFSQHKNERTVVGLVGTKKMTVDACRNKSLMD